MFTITDQIILDLKQAGITVFFGVQGGACARIIQTVINNGCTYVPVLNEQAAGYAAHGYFLSKDKPAGIILTTGPGVTNSISGIASCYYDSIPTVVLMGQIKSELNLAKIFSTKMNGFQELPHLDLVDPVSDTSLNIKSEQDYSSIREAIFQLNLKKNKVISIEIQDDIQRLQISRMDDLEDHQGKITFDTNLSNSSQIEVKADLLLLGAGCRNSVSQNHINNINQSGVPVALSWGAQYLGPQLKNCIGIFGTHTPGFANEMLKKSIYPVVVGCSLLQHQIGKSSKLFLPNSNSIKFVNSDNQEINRAITIFGSRLNGHLSDSGNFFQDYKIINQENITDNKFNDEFYKDEMVPNLLSLVIQEFSNHGKYIFTDAGATLSWSYQAMNMKQNWSLGAKMFTSFNLHPMGFSNCALFGAGIESNEMSLAIIGDGSVPMNCQEFAQLKNKEHLKVVVVDNHGYGIIRQTQDAFYDGNHLGSSFETIAPLPYFDVQNIVKGFDLSCVLYDESEVNQKNIISFFKGSDQVLILKVNNGLKVMTDFYKQ